MAITATAKADRRTKNLVKRLQPGDIAVICHEDLDQVAAADLVAKKVSAVINARQSITGKYPNLGPQTLLKANIVLVDNVGDSIMNLPENSTVTIDDNGRIYKDRTLITQGTIITAEIAEQKIATARENIGQALNKFIDTDLRQKRKSFITGQIDIPETSTQFKDKHILIVARNNFREDLATIRNYVTM